MTDVFSQEKVCSTDFMAGDLNFLTRSEIKEWLKEIKQIDSIIDRVLEAELPTIASNHNRLSSELVAKCKDLLNETGFNYKYNLENLEVFHGYRFYNKPDDGKMRELTHNPDAYYGVAKASTFGVTHRHFQSGAFNLVLEGEGIFTGDILEKGMFKNFYHGDLLIPGKELEIELGMTHGHLIRKESTMWLFAYQHCGFGVGLSCEGDFHELVDYNTVQFGANYE